MSIPFFDYVKLRLSSTGLFKVLTKAEYNLVESIYQFENDITAISEDLLAHLRHEVIKATGDAEGETFDHRLRRAYVAYHLRTYSGRLSCLFPNRTWARWLAEECTIGVQSLDKVQQIIGVNINQRPAKAIAWQSANVVNRADAPALRKERYAKLCAAVKQRGFAKRIAEQTDHISYSKEDFCVTLFHTDRNNYVEISVDADHDEESCYMVEANEEMTYASHKTPEEAVDGALAELEDISENRKEAKVKKAKVKQAAVPVAPRGRLLAALKATDPDDLVNYGGYANPSPNTFYLLDEDHDRALRITIIEGDDYPFVLDQVLGVKRSHGAFALETGVLQKAWDVLDQFPDRDDEDDDEDDELEEAPLAKKAPAKKQEVVKIVSKKSDEEYKHIFSPFTLARCPALMEFSKYRAEMLRDAGDDLTNVVSTYSVVKDIAEHYMTRILASLWPDSFEFDLVDDDEEEPVYTLSVAPFRIKVTTEKITVEQHHVKGSITFTQTIQPHLTTTERLDIAMQFFDTWSSERTAEVLNATGFACPTETGNIFRSDNKDFTLVDCPVVPEFFYSEANPHVEQVQCDGDYLSLRNFLSDGVSSVRGVHFTHTMDYTYRLVITPEIDLELFAVGSKAVVSDFIRLVAHTAASQAFFRGVADDDISLDYLRSKGMVVTQNEEQVTMEFIYEGNMYMVHAYV